MQQRFLNHALLQISQLSCRFRWLLHGRQQSAIQIGMLFLNFNRESPPIRRHSGFTSGQNKRRHKSAARQG
jgi:hypothetical protein